MGARAGGLSGGLGYFGGPLFAGAPGGGKFPWLQKGGGYNRQDFQDYLNAYKAERQGYNTAYMDERKRIQALPAGTERQQAYRDLIRYGPTSYRQPQTPATPATPAAPVPSVYDVAYENEVKRRAELDKLMQGTAQL